MSPVQNCVSRVAGAAVYLLIPDEAWPWDVTREENLQYTLKLLGYICGNLD